MSITINCPRNLEAHAIVLNGTGPAGQMCARGLFIERNPLGGAAEIIVKAKVYSGHLTHIPDTPPADAVTVSLVGQGWRSETIPAPECSATSPYPPLTLVVWQMSGTGTGADEVASVRFCGRCAGAVDCCEGSGTGIPCGSGAIAEESRSVSGGAVAAVMLAPAMWSLVIEGVLTPLGSAFNGTWLLRLRDGDGVAGVWDNGSDGADSPLIELCCDAPPVALWRLRLRHLSFTLEYTALPLWNALHPLTLTARATPLSPPTLTVIPA